jgi:excisionase family DNA binding protein
MYDLPEKKYLRPDEVAAFWSVSVKTIYRWVDMGVLEAVKVGGCLRVSRDAVNNLGKMEGE